MTRFFRNVVVVAALATMVILPLSPAGAADAGNQVESARVTLRATGANWQPEFEFESAVLTVSGPHDVALRKEFAAGDSIEINLSDAASGSLPDGQYAWELVFSPRLSSEQKDRLRTARESGDDAAINEMKSKGKLPIEVAPSSGYFRIAGGNIVVAEQTEKPLRRVSPQTEGDAQPGAVNDQDVPIPAKDQVITDDLIVTFSACVGNDCVNGESFGFDTLRLKENNTRIKFQDTSATSSFPSVDWQLTANDSANGGANKFSIDDIDSGRTPFTIEHSAPSHSLYVDDGGRIGLGTSTPVVELHVVDGDSPTLRLEQDGSSGFTAQTWDVAGNETNFFVRDVTNGSRLPFKIRPSAPTNSIYVNTNGDVGFGTASPASAFHVSRTGHVLPLFESSDGNAVQFRIKSASDNRRIVALDGSNNVESQIVLKDNGTIEFLGPTASDLHATFSSTGLNVNGTISLNTVQIHPDYVFESGYELRTIDEQAAYMWANSHLPAVGPGTYDAQGKAVIDLAGKTMGILEELEKAHIYIAQLHQRLEEEEQERRELSQRLATIEKSLALIGQSGIAPPRED